MGQAFDTRSVHLSKKFNQDLHSKTTPIYQTSAFTFKSLEDIEKFYAGEKDYLYSRVGNPNPDELAEAVAELEGAPKGLASGSGLSAILLGVLSVAKAGDHILCSSDIYGGTYELFAKELPDFGIAVTFHDFNQDIAASLQENTVLLYSESITNPLLRVENLDAILNIAKKHNLKTMIDNTFATPYLFNPYQEGINLVVHSATKYLGGHSDITAGVLVGDEDLITRAKQKGVNLGTTLSPMEAWLTVRGLKTLSVRMERHVQNAQKLAQALDEHPLVDKVYYPNHVSEKGNGAIVSIDITKSCHIETFFKALGWVKIVPTLAGVETSVSYPIATSHRNLTPDIQQELGITKGLVRISVGIEDGTDIIEAFKNAIEKSKI